jgi:hypothetical protein
MDIVTVTVQTPKNNPNPTQTPICTSNDALNRSQRDG